MTHVNAGSSPTSRPPENFARLNGLRGIAALVVIISHSANAGFLPGIFGKGFGQMGVCLFFILSGFLMGHLYLGQDFSAQNIRLYAIKRAARVLPLFFFCLLLTMLAYVFFDKHLYSINSLQALLGNALLLHGTSVLWSIPVEIHFYVVFAGIWLAIERGMGVIPLLVTLIIFQVTTAVLLVVLFDSSKFLPFWLHVFVFGTLVSVAYRSHYSSLSGLTQSRLLVGLSWIVALAIVFCLPELRRDLGIRTVRTFMDPISVGYPALVFVLVLLNLGPFKFLDAKPMQWLGKVSFSLYLLHMPVLVLTKSWEPVGQMPLLGFLTVLTVTILASWVTFNAIERPAQSWLKTALLRNQPKPSYYE